MQICVCWKCMKPDISFTCKKSHCFLPVKTKETKKETKQKTSSFIRSSRPKVFSKKGVFRNLTKFTGKHLCQRFFFNCSLQACNVIKKRLWIRCFPVNFAKFL